LTASLSLFDKEHAAREKYIYFICGVSSALVAYLGKDYKPNHPWTVHDTLMVATLGSLLLSFLFGIGRMLSYIKAISLNKDMLVAREETGNFVDAFTKWLDDEKKGAPIMINKKTGERFTKEQIEEEKKQSFALAEKYSVQMKRWFRASAVLYVICHVFLVAGFVLMMWAKVA
jgi:hypothetical protein